MKKNLILFLLLIGSLCQPAYGITLDDSFKVLNYGIVMLGAVTLSTYFLLRFSYHGKSSLGDISRQQITQREALLYRSLANRRTSTLNAAE